MHDAKQPGIAEVEAELSPRDYELFRALVYERSGINLGSQKQQLVRARLGKRMRAGRFQSYRAYYEYVQQDATGAELSALIDAISTNTTHLFREKQHFDFLAEALRAGLTDRARRSRPGPLRIWSAGCSSGDEPYSIAMTVADALHGELDWRILATDISTRVLALAALGRYETHRLGTVPAPFRAHYFSRDERGERGYVQVTPALRKHITFAQLNLMDAQFPFRHGFQWIFCRNVMIYFDRPTQVSLVARLASHLRPGGYLLIGHSESLNGVQHSLRYVQPTVYQKSGE